MKRHGTTLEIDLGMLSYNHQLLKKNYPDKKVLFMVKANAYGHGAISIVRFAVEELQIKEFGVATLGEGLELRSAHPDLEFEIFVFSDLMIDHESLSNNYSAKRMIPVISSLSDLKIMLQHKDLKNVPLCVKINTGMNRLGISHEDRDQILSLLKQHKRDKIHHLISHFANSFLSDEFSLTKCREQENIFYEIKRMFEDEQIKVCNSSLSNSGAIDQMIGLDGTTHIRPGLMMYGPSSISEVEGQTSIWSGKNISKLSARVIKVFRVKEGDEIGYGSNKAPNQGTIAILAIGYGDGFSCRFKSPMIPFKGRAGHILGRINMDTTMIFFNGVTDDFIHPGDEYPIWGHDQKDIISLSHQTETIPYEHFCQLTERIPRKYIFEGER